MKHIRFSISTLVLFSLLFAILPGTVLAADAIIQLTPPTQTINVDQTTTVAMYVQNVQNLYGYQAALSFNPTILEVVDADASKPGVQVALGNFLSPDFVQQNNADNSLGAIVCVVSQMAPSVPVNGSGVLFTITFRSKAQGTSPIQFTDLKLARHDGVEISTSVQLAQVQVVNPSTPTTPTPTPTAVPPTPTPTATSMAPTATPSATATPTPTLVPGQTVIHVVKPGETLYSIARLYGVSVAALTYLNKITDPSRIYVGQHLIIPRGSNQPVPTGTPAPTATPRPLTPIVYVVQPGDTLYSIARRYGTTVQAIAALNNIVNPSRIYAGQRLTIYAGTVPPSTPQRIHIVQYGETLFSIARRYGTTAWAISMANNLYNPNVIYAGQRLVIP